jgi:hypothetical protein
MLKYYFYRTFFGEKDYSQNDRIKEEFHHSKDHGQVILGQSLEQATPCR